MSRLYNKADYLSVVPRPLYWEVDELAADLACQWPTSPRCVIGRSGIRIFRREARYKDQHLLAWRLFAFLSRPQLLPERRARLSDL